MLGNRPNYDQSGQQSCCLFRMVATSPSACFTLRRPPVFLLP